MSLVGRLNMGSLIGGASWLAAAQAFSMACGLAATTVWARLMPPELFGEFRVLMGIIVFVAAFCLMGTGQASMMSAAGNVDGNFLSLLRLKLAANAIGSLALVAAAGYYAWAPASSPSIAFALLAAAFLFPIYNTSDIWTAWINGKGLFRELALSQALTAALAVGAVLVVAISNITQPWIVALIYLGAASLQTLAMLLSAFRRLSNDVTDPSIIAFGHHTSLAMTFSGLVALDVVILSHVYTPHDVAIYVVALQFPELLKRMFSVLGSMLAPRIYAARNFRSMWRDIRAYLLIITAGCIAVGVIGFFLLPPLTVWLFSERYAEAAEYGRWLWLTVACCGSTTLLGPALLATKKPFFVYTLNVGYSLWLAMLFVLFVGGGVAGLTLARIVAVLALSIFYVTGFVYCLRASASEVVRR